MATIGDQELKLVDDYAEALDAISARSVYNTQKALQRALLRTLKDLRRYYAQFVNPELQAIESGDGVIRRPGSYSIADGSAKYKKLLEIAQEYFPDSYLASVERQYKKDFADAIALGGELSQNLINITSPDAMALAPFVGASKLQIEAAAKTASAYIRREVESFRDDIARIVTDGIGRGKGPRSLESDIRIALKGAKDPTGITKRLGLYQRAELIARSELANAYVGAQKATAARNGYSYGRWIATQDERTCQICASRHGNIYRLDEMVGTQHPRCRCSISPIASEAVEEPDPEIRKEFLRTDYWEQSKKRVWQSFAKSKGWDFDKASSVLEKAVLKPSPSEKRLYPDIQQAPIPVA
jgi:SPP1 gp7 family putative phage head morphogenesis protein